MKFLMQERKYTGVEISQECIINAVLSNKKKCRLLKRCFLYPLPDDTVKPSFKRENILHPEHFRRALQKSLKKSRIKRGDIAVSLPNESVKILVRQFTDLPRDKAEKNEMVLWNAASTLGLSINDIKVAWQPMGTAADGNQTLLIALASKNVLAQYELEIKKAGFYPKVLSPAGIHQFNFFSSAVSEKGSVAYLGLFGNYVTIFIFIDSIPVFYKTIKKGLFSLDQNSFGSVDSFYFNDDKTSGEGRPTGVNHNLAGPCDGKVDKRIARDIDLVFQYYHSTFPDISIEKICIASQGLPCVEKNIPGNKVNQKKILQKDDTDKKQVEENENVEMIILNEAEFIEVAKGVFTDGCILPYIASAGAALSLY